MNKAAALITVFIFLLFSCKQPSPVAKRINKINPLIGEWMIVAFGTVNPGSKTVWGQCNSCALVTFSNDHSGLVKTEGGELINAFTWQVKNNVLTLKFPENIKNTSFIKSGVPYTMSYSKKRNYRRIALLDTKSNFELLLDGPRSNSELIHPESVDQ